MSIHVSVVELKLKCYQTLLVKQILQALNLRQLRNDCNRDKNIVISKLHIG